MSGGPTIWHGLDRVLARLRPHREPLSLLVDALTVALAWNATYLFRLGFERWISARPGYDHLVMLGVVAAYAGAFLLLRVPRGMWRFSGFGEIQRLTGACVLAGAACAAVVIGMGLTKVPRAVLALHPLVALMSLALVRVFYRMLYEHARRQITGRDDAEIRRALVLGAGEAARLLLAGIHQRGWIVLGLLDDDPAKQGARIAGVPVLGGLKALGDPEVRSAATHVIVAMPSLRGRDRRRVLDLAAASGLPVLTVPSAHELRDGDAVNRVRNIEPEDLLGREPVQLDEAGIAGVLTGATVMVTGAGGSIGSELCRQVARYRPARLVLFELSEFNLYTIEQDLGERHPAVELVRLIGDVKDLDLLRQVCALWKPSVVFHAAAYKHVPLMEEDGNAWQCLRNNLLGTWNAARAAAEAGCRRFVLISTDKAVNPTSVMGATKRAAEMAMAALVPEFADTRFMAVRFGNVLGSSGSVIPKFKEQIARGGPVTVTHPEMVRYFMTIPEAARLVLQAAAIGESGQVLVLDMGEPVRILDLARRLIQLSGRETGSVPIHFSGVRPGEKLVEELWSSADATLPVVRDGLRAAALGAESGRAHVQKVVRMVAASAAPARSRDDVFRLLSQILAGSVTAETGPGSN